MVRFINREDEDEEEDGYGAMIERSKQKIRELFGGDKLPSRDKDDQ